MSFQGDFEAVSDPLWHRLHDATKSAEKGEKPSYQELLRCVGQFFDAHEASRIHVLEVIDGFSVRYQTGDTPDSTRTAHLTETALARTGRDLETRRRRLSFHFGRRAEEADYEDILRALGYELDVVRAYSLLIDELDDGIVVTYQFLKPTEGFNVRKRMVILGQEAMRSVVADAHHRREQRSKGVLTLLAG